MCFFDCCFDMIHSTTPSQYYQIQFLYYWYNSAENVPVFNQVFAGFSVYLWMILGKNKLNAQA